MRSRLTFTGLAVLAAAVATLFGFQSEPRASAAEGKIAQQVMLDTANGQTASFVVYLEDQADLSAAAAIADEDERGWYVYNTLRAKAAATQPAITAELDAEGVPYTTYWAVNMIAVDADRSVAIELAERDDVASVESNEVVDGLDGEDEAESTDEGNEVAVIESGITQSAAPPLWNLGFTGQGIVVANQDTGMRWTHAALRTHYRGWGGSIGASTHDYNWWDSIHAQITSADGGTASPATNPCGRNLVVPCDDHGHGTHTTGTSVGDDAGAGVGTGTNQVGVAPGAKWIGCRNMDSGNGRASTYTECFQFFLAPTTVTGANPDPSKRPHVMNNSWGCPQAGELCAPNVMKTIVENSEAAGIFVEASAGNDGPGCGTVTDPPAIYEASFSTGSITATNAMSSFSSRGPVGVDGSGRMKPDLVARGSSVRSATRTSDTAYSTSSGTSMAGPHVVGAVALLWSAKPRLVRDIPRTKWLLTRSANPIGISTATTCGGTSSVPNNHFGWGRLDVLAAYNLEPSLEQTIDFPAIADTLATAPDFALDATASSGLDVSYTATGSCTVSGNVVHVTTGGACTVTAHQAGLAAYSVAASAPKPWYPAESVSRTFQALFPFSGYSPPFGKRAETQAGASFPVKFKLGDDFGLAVLAEGWPKTKACGAADDTLVPAVQSEPFAFVNGEYRYSWKTEKTWANTCRELVFQLVDGESHSATVQFKK